MDNTPLNIHGQPVNRGFNYKRNELKAAFGLKGILQGVVADQRLKKVELLFLDVWMKSQKYLKIDEGVDADGDQFDVYSAIQRILNGGDITRDELDDMNQHINDVIENGAMPISNNASKINELYGLMSGLVSDEQLNNDEVFALNDWLNKNPDIIEDYPAFIIAERVRAILEDGVIDDEEKEDLTETLKQISGIRFNESGIAYGMSTEFVTGDIDELDHMGSKICFTGRFISGDKRVTLSKTVSDLGAIVKDNVTLDLDYLIIGGLASRDWKFTGHGNKISKAIEYKLKGCPINIISENTWSKFLS